MIINIAKQRIAVALCVSFAMWAGTASASLVGDTVTVGHYQDANPLPGATEPSTFTVEAGNADTYTFYNSFPYAYRVNVEANRVLVDFNYLRYAAGTWDVDYQSCWFNPSTGFGCNTVPFSFNGLGVSGLNDSSGNPLQNVVIDTNMAGWDSSRLAFGNDYVQFDWKGLSFNSDIWSDWTETTLVTPATYFNATLSFGPAAPVPEPETYVMLLVGLGLLSFTAKRRKQSA